MAPNGSLSSGPGDPAPLIKRLHRLYRKARKRVLGPIQRPVAPSNEPPATREASGNKPPVSPTPAAAEPKRIKPAHDPIEYRPPISSAAFEPVLARSAATGAVPPAAPPGNVDAFAMRALQRAKAENPDGEAGDDIFFPPFERTVRAPLTPPSDVCFMVPTDAKSLAAVEMLLLSLLDVYPALSSPLLIAMETPPDVYLRRRFAHISPLIEFVMPPPGWDEAYANMDREPPRRRLTLYALSITAHGRIVVLQPDTLVLGDISEAWTGRGLILGYDVSDAGFVTRTPFTGDYIYDIEVISIPAEMRGLAAVAAMSALTHDQALAESSLDRQPVQRCWNLFLRDREKTVLPLRCSLSAMYVLKCLEGSRQGVCLLHDNGEDPWLSTGGK